MNEQKLKIGFVPASRNFFSHELAIQMREQTIETLAKLGIDCVVTSNVQTSNGCVETRKEAVVCGQMLRDAKVDGILVGAMNFADEQGVAMALREAGMDVPVMILGCQKSSPLRFGIESTTTLPTHINLLKIKTLFIWVKPALSAIIQEGLFNIKCLDLKAINH